MATAALLVHEYLLTFEDEWRLVWPSKLSVTKVAFFINRYTAFVANLFLIIYGKQRHRHRLNGIKQLNLQVICIVDVRKELDVCMLCELPGKDH